jgi:hypothetical protein
VAVRFRSEQEGGFEKVGTKAYGFRERSRKPT